MAVIFLFLLSASSFAKNCTSEKLSPPERAIVKWVYDGDTLLLKDKRKIRIIGIDTPEVKHHQQRAQAYAAKAREALRQLLRRFNYHVFLRYGAEKKDRYSRVLAHIYLPDGTNISNWLLERGFAKTMAFPPNIKLAKCYKQSEEIAQKKSLRIWRYKKNQIRTVDSLSSQASGYVRLKGVINKIKRYKKSFIAIFKENDKRPVRIKIKKKNQKYFKSLKLDKLRNKTILVAGSLRNRYGKRTIYVSYPTQLKILASEKNADNSKNINMSAGKSAIKWSLKK